MDIDDSTPIFDLSDQNFVNYFNHVCDTILFYGVKSKKNSYIVQASTARDLQLQAASDPGADVDKLKGMFDNLCTILASLPLISADDNVNSNFVKHDANSKPNVDKNVKPKTRNKRTSDKNDDDFKNPSKTAKQSNSKPEVTNFISKNNYDCLNENIDCDNISDITEISDNVKVTQSPCKTRVIRPESITIKMTPNWSVIIKNIEDSIGSVTRKTLRGDCIRIIPSDLDQYHKIQNFIIENNIEAFGNRLKNERPKKVLIKGIPPSTPIESVKSELMILNFEIHRVSQLKNFKTKRPMPIFLIDLLPSQNFREIYEIESFLGFHVVVEAYRSKGAKQCYRCQRYNHSSENCTFNPVCLKCAAAHLTKDCKIIEKDQLKCGNCQGNHTANYGGCIANPKNKNKSPTKRGPSIIFNSNFSNPGTSYSNAVQNQAPPAPIHQNSNSELLQKPSNNRKPLKTSPPPLTISNFPPIQSTTPTLNVIPETQNLDSVIEKLEKIVSLLEKIQKLYNSDSTLANFIQTCNPKNQSLNTKPPASTPLNPPKK